MSVEEAKKNAAYQAVDENLMNNKIIGIGSGSTIVYAVKRIADWGKQDIICIPSSFQTTQILIHHGLSIGSLNEFPVVDVTFDGADEIDEDLNLIKGGGGCHVQEKILAYNSKRVIIVADFNKDSKVLGEKWKKGVPIEVIPSSYIPIMKKIEKMKGIPTLRMAVNKAGPIVTDNGNFILDADFSLIKNPLNLELELIRIPGIVETGLFVDMVDGCYIGLEDGSVKKVLKK
ncbi:MAG: ribose 5-phosphate isomerase A [Candidatus Lokiarchaeota archaeon]|nr:ribose 5-phosphate isomerase A [Candidatus Lokiarchaeota archaeon]